MASSFSWVSAASPEELEAAGVRLNDPEAALGRLVLVLQRIERGGDVRLPEHHLALVGERLAALDDADGVVIDAEALGARIARGLGERGFDEIEAIEAVLGREPAIGDREETDELAGIGDAGTADGLLVLLAMLREGL